MTYDNRNRPRHCKLFAQRWKHICISPWTPSIRFFYKQEKNIIHFDVSRHRLLLSRKHWLTAPATCGDSSVGCADTGSPCKARSKERSKQRRINLLDQAQQAANRGDAHGLWAPKAPRGKLQLRRNGHMISVEAEMDWILEAYGQRYSVQDEDIQVHFAFAPHPGIHIEATDLEWFLFRLNPRKATPKDTAPALLVKACARSLSGSTAQQLNAIWGQGGHYVPTRWSDADVALLVKAHGRSASPLDLRPIGVQDALGKAVMSTVILRAKQAIHTLISQFPQCAYIKGRSTGTALRQAFSHCREIRDSCSQARLTIRQKFEGRTRTECQGGLQASLDLSAAFDLVQWTSVKQALDLAGVELAVQDILMSWLSQVRYLFRHKHLRGILRQTRLHRLTNPLVGLHSAPVYHH